MVYMTSTIRPLPRIASASGVDLKVTPEGARDAPES
jgi:hypothetical protein